MHRYVRQGLVGQARELAPGRLLLRLLAVARCAHRTKQRQQIEPVGLQQHPRVRALLQLLARQRKRCKKGLPQRGPLAAAQVAHIGAACGQGGVAPGLLQAHLCQPRGQPGGAERTQLGFAAAQQRPAHSHLNLGALVIAAQGVGHRFARAGQAGAAKQPRALAGMGRVLALRGQRQFGL